MSQLINDRKGTKSKHFLQRIRQYNSIFAFTSMGANIISDINKGEAPYIFRINDQIQCAELYIFDTKNENENRIKTLHEIDKKQI